MDREKLIKNLERKGLRIVGLSEDFNGDEGGIWLSAEEQENIHFFDYYSMSRTYELGVRKTFSEFLLKRGWFAEWNDPGTIMLWTI